MRCRCRSKAVSSTAYSRAICTGTCCPTSGNASWRRRDERAGGLVVAESAKREDVSDEEWQERVLNDGSPHRVYKRYFTGAGLARELGGEVMHEGRWFVVVAS